MSELNAIEDLRSFRPAMLVQPLVGAAFALVIVMLLKAGLLGLTLPNGNAQAHALAVFAFIAGFSEPFVVGVVGRVVTLADDGWRWLAVESLFAIPSRNKLGRTRSDGRRGRLLHS